MIQNYGRTEWGFAQDLSTTLYNTEYIRTVSMFVDTTQFSADGYWKLDFQAILMFWEML